MLFAFVTQIKKREAEIASRYFYSIWLVDDGRSDVLPRLRVQLLTELPMPSHLSRIMLVMHVGFASAIRAQFREFPQIISAVSHQSSQ